MLHVCVCLEYFIFINLQGPSVYPFTSFVAEQLKETYYSKVRVTSMMLLLYLHILYMQDELFEFDMWILPIHLGAHWAMLVQESTCIIMYMYVFFHD